MSHNPMEDLQRPKDPAHRERQISQREIDAVLLALNYSEESPVIEQRQKVAVAFLLAIESGMRAGEMCGLIAEHVNLDDQTVFLPDTKNGRARSVPLSKEAVRLLQRLEPWGEDGRVFGVASGVLSSLFKVGVTKTKIKDLTFHDTRHEAITRLAKKLDVLDLARMVGHRDIKQLLTYYNKSAKEIATQLG